MNEIEERLKIMELIIRGKIMTVDEERRLHNALSRDDWTYEEAERFLDSNIYEFIKNLFDEKCAKIEGLETQIHTMKSCGNCIYTFEKGRTCYMCINRSEWRFCEE